MSVTRIYVNAAAITTASIKGGRADRPILIEPEGEPRKSCNRVRLTGPSVIVYDPNNPQGLGARCWVETHAPVEILD